MLPAGRKGAGQMAAFYNLPLLRQALPVIRGKLPLVLCVRVLELLHAGRGAEPRHRVESTDRHGQQLRATFRRLPSRFSSRGTPRFTVRVDS